MDPMTAISLEFVRELRREWSSDGPTQDGHEAPRARRAPVTARLRTAVGDRLIATGLWLGGRYGPLTSEAGDYRT
jgi:hypothetical protein